MSRSRELKLTGIILRRKPYKETSLLLKIFTKEAGLISSIIHGVRKEKSKLTGIIEPGNLLNLICYKNPNSEFYIVKSAILEKLYIVPRDFFQQMLFQTIHEIYEQIMIEHNDIDVFFNLLIKLYQYLPTVSENKVLVFWRFLIRIMNELGGTFNIDNCVICEQKEVELVRYYAHADGFICKNCSIKIPSSMSIPISEKIIFILKNIKNIGNYLHCIKMDRNTFKQFNNIYLMHFYHNFHYKIKSKSLVLLENSEYIDWDKN